MLLFLNVFKKDKGKTKEPSKTTHKPKRSNEQIANRKGELGEYKIDIQLDQLPKSYHYLSDLLIKNPKAKSGYSQVDHVVITPYGIFVIETKNYQGTIYGGKDRKTWLINGKFKMMNPFVQNYGHIKALTGLIDNRYHDMMISMVSFTKRCTFKVDMDFRKIGSNELIVYDVELSEFIHRKVSRQKKLHAEPLLSEKEMKEIKEGFYQANITDPKIWEAHKQALKSNKHENKAKCVVCEQPVSQKVENYCLSQKKFNGEVYCYNHQKEIKR
ncbi:nuclease-related domain-containing protein [Alkalibacillus aidingensis]|uniref:nuclease-related domain-containing protein n=1 Tax=Alkalibacillus aidingensis TaxID=2747607 RepID=UPI001660B40D|nr:nuclease-related domain-containing protein [Alkalibacillus aidingensis]